MMDRRKCKCERDQCMIEFNVTCTGNCYQICKSQLVDFDNKFQKIRLKKNETDCPKYSRKYLLSLSTTRIWLVAPGRKITTSSMDLRKSKLYRIPNKLIFIQQLEAIRLDNNPCFNDLSFLKYLKNLKVIGLKNCNITKFSDTEIQGSGLMALDLNGNTNISDFSDIRFISKLLHLNIGSCRLTTIPKEVLNFRSLSVLILDDNKLNEYLIDLQPLQNLQVLLLQRCGLSKIPKSIFTLESLLFLSIESNSVKTITSELAKLRQLSVLNVYENRDIQMSNKLTRCPSLKRINVDHNFSIKLVSPKMRRLIKVWKDSPCAWWKQL